VVCLKNGAGPQGRHFLSCNFINHSIVPRLRRSLVLRKFLIHALTGVAIECRPFGPGFCKLTSASASNSAAQLVQRFLQSVFGLGSQAKVWATVAKNSGALRRGGGKVGVTNQAGSHCLSLASVMTTNKTAKRFFSGNRGQHARFSDQILSRQ
jgi:hypothetical protein